MQLKTKLFFLLIFSLMFPSLGLAAACCGGGMAAPSVIIGDDKAQLATSYSYAEVTDYVGTDSYWRKSDSRDSTETFTINGSHIFADRWQAGLSIPVVQRSRVNEKLSGLGDVSTTVGYEYLPDWDYNPWRPKGLGFLQLTFPTGKSIYESDSRYQLDSRGRGFWSIGVGTILTKTFGRLDAFSNFDIHRSFDKTYSNSQTQGTLKPGYGGNFGLGAGFNFADLRVGGGLAWTYEDPVDVTGSVNSTGFPQRFATASLTGSYLFQNEWSATLTYTDQTLVGNPANTSLGKSVALLFQKRWLR